MTQRKSAEDSRSWEPKNPPEVKPPPPPPPPSRPSNPQSPKKSG